MLSILASACRLFIFTIRSELVLHLIRLLEVCHLRLPILIRPKLPQLLLLVAIKLPLILRLAILLSSVIISKVLAFLFSLSL
jgi:hypothetical protein